MFRRSHAVRRLCPMHQNYFQTQVMSRAASKQSSQDTPVEGDTIEGWLIQSLMIILHLLQKKLCPKWVHCPEKHWLRNKKEKRRLDREPFECEATIVTGCYFRKNGILMRKWRPPEVPTSHEWKGKNQALLPMYQSILPMEHPWLDI